MINLIKCVTEGIKKMDKNNLKIFARKLRNRLREMVEVKINYYLTGEDIEIKYREKQISELKKEIDATGLDGVIEKVSYIWFNRFVAIRFMELKGYTKSRIMSPLPEMTVPEILEQAKGGLIDDDLPVDRNKINDLLDGKINSREPEEEVYRMLITGICNYYHKIMPFMFEWIDDYTELLIPDNLLRAGSVRDEIVKNISEEDCEDVEIIGWLYQYYISEKKEEVDKKIKKDEKVEKVEIPCYTQKFTPKWIVKYMVDNSLGRLWLEVKPDSIIKEEMKYFVETEEIEKRSISSPEEITIFDPCCGSGHILVYAFELLTRIYEEEGYSKSEIPELILKNNLFGIDIDDRAASLASFALIMKARGYYARFFRKSVDPKIIFMEDISFSYEEKDFITKYFRKDIFSGELGEIIEKFRFAKNYGSLIQIFKEINIEDLLKRAEDMRKEEDLFYKEIGRKVESLFKQILFLSKKYDCVITNPPYLGNGNMNANLIEFVKKYYLESKMDLFSCFIDRCMEFTVTDGFTSMITMQSWMFLKSLEKLRLKVLDSKTIITLAHFGNMVMEIAFGTSAFVLSKIKDGLRGVYFKRVIADLNESRQLEALTNDRRYSIEQANFKKIPNSPIAYWANNREIEIFERTEKLKDIAEPKIGMRTGDNERFLRRWYEVNIYKIGIGFKNAFEAQRSLKKWFPYNKGGEYRKWYGNNERIVNWENDGFEIKENTKLVYPQLGENLGWKISNEKFYFKESITWSFISSSKFGVRYCPQGFIFDVAGSSVFPSEKDFKYLVGFLCSKLTFNFLEILNPTMNFQVGDIASLPVIISENTSLITYIDTIINQNISISRTDWDSLEISWDFKINPLVACKNIKIEESYNTWKSSIEEQFNTLQRNEEELNRIFIEIYGLQDELTPDVELKDITILKDETFINDRGELEFKPDEVMKQFISYSVGCIFGRYSPDKEGLILANQGETVEDYIKIINQTPSFTPDEDNILPVLSDEYFENDIVSLFNKFLKLAFGDDTFHENLAFIEEKLGKSMRAYFEKDFYSDHVKRYKKRPIYWLFQSPKKYFQALIYMHRYKSDICSKVLNDYLREYIVKQEYRKVQIKKDMDSVSLSGKEKTRKEKEIKEIDKILKDLAEYDKKLDHMAKQYISIDLDDGVRVNYCKFKDVLAPISGLEKE